MVTKTIAYCDHCGAQMSVIDFDGEVINEGYKISNPFQIVQTNKTESGSSYKNVFEIAARDICSLECLEGSFDKLIKLLQVQR